MARVGVLTTTFYKSTDELRFQLACQLVGNAVGCGHSVIIVDGSNSELIRLRFRNIGANVFEQTSKGMGSSRRELFYLAQNFLNYRDRVLPDFFILTEPEKTDLIRFLPELIEPLEKCRAQIVIPERTPLSFLSYPDFQAESERIANQVYTKEVHNNFDVMFGPVVFNRVTLPFFAECNPKESYGAHDSYIQHIAPIEAMSRGINVCSVPIDFFYPASQRLEEESSLSEEMRMKRKKQFNDCTLAFKLCMGKLKQ